MTDRAGCGPVVIGLHELSLVGRRATSPTRAMSLAQAFARGVVRARLVA